MLTESCNTSGKGQRIRGVIIITAVFHHPLMNGHTKWHCCVDVIVSLVRTSGDTKKKQLVTSNHTYCDIRNFDYSIFYYRLIIEAPPTLSTTISVWVEKSHQLKRCFMHGCKVWYFISYYMQLALKHILILLIFCSCLCHKNKPRFLSCSRRCTIWSMWKICHWKCMKFNSLLLSHSTTEPNFIYKMCVCKLNQLMEVQCW